MADAVFNSLLLRLLCYDNSTTAYAERSDAEDALRAHHERAIARIAELEAHHKRYRALIREVVEAHRLDNDCERDPCLWCQDAMQAIDAARSERHERRRG